MGSLNQWHSKGGQGAIAQVLSLGLSERFLSEVGGGLLLFPKSSDDFTRSARGLRHSLLVFAKTGSDSVLGIRNFFSPGCQMT